MQGALILFYFIKSCAGLNQLNSHILSILQLETV